MAIKGTGRRGPPRDAPHLKLISGTNRADQAATGPIEICDGSDPLAPDHLTEDELMEWTAAINLLRPMGLLSGADVGILTAYVISKCIIRDASFLIRAEGLLSLGASGTNIPNPLIGIRNRAMNDLVSYAVQLGMTPAARLRLNAEVSTKKVNRFEHLKNDA